MTDDQKSHANRQQQLRGSTDSTVAALTPDRWPSLASRGTLHPSREDDTFHQPNYFDRDIANRQYAFPWYFLPETVVTPVKVAAIRHITAAARKPTRSSHLTNSSLQMVVNYSSYRAPIHAPPTFNTRTPTVGLICFYHAMPTFKQISLLSLIRLAKGGAVYFNYIPVTQQSASGGGVEACLEFFSLYTTNSENVDEGEYKYFTIDHSMAWGFTYEEKYCRLVFCHKGYFLNYQTTFLCKIMLHNMK